MPVVSNRPKTLSNVVKVEMWQEHGFCRKELIANEAADITYQVGTVLGTVTADGKVKKAVAGAGDGSETPSAIFMGAGPSFAPTLDVVAGQDVALVALVQGPAIIGDDQLDLGAGITVDDVKTALGAKFINVETQIENQLNNA